jgi:hypothetical protein
MEKYEAKDSSIIQYKSWVQKNDQEIMWALMVEGGIHEN